MTTQELLEDAECLAMLRSDPKRPPRSDKKSTIFAFTFPAQDFKLRIGDKVFRAGSGESAGEIVFIDDTERRVELKLGPSRSRIDEGASLIPEGPIGDEPLREAIYRYATQVAAAMAARIPPLPTYCRCTHHALKRSALALPSFLMRKTWFRVRSQRSEICKQATF
jgi:uncharacterized protein